MDLLIPADADRLRLAQRGEQYGDMVLFDLRDGRGRASIDRPEWLRCLSWYGEQVAPARRLLKWLFWLQLPMAIFSLMVLSRMGAVGWIDRMFPGTAGVIPMIVMIGWPITAGLAVYEVRHRRALATIVAELADRPRVERQVEPRRRAWHAVELLALILIGPHLVLACLGSALPTLFDDTPWMGTRLGMLDIAGLAILALMLMRRRQRVA